MTGSTNDRRGVPTRTAISRVVVSVVTAWNSLFLPGLLFTQLHAIPMTLQPTYRNVMETLVIEALEHHLHTLSREYDSGGDSNDPDDLNDAIAYALNRLPAVYTTNELNWARQCDRLRRSMGELIHEAALWGLERSSQPRSRRAS